MAARKTANLPVNYEEQLAKEAANISRRIAAPSGDRIRIKQGNTAMITPDGNEGTELECVILDFVSSNLYYEGAFDKDNPTPPACFAISPEPTMMIPSDNSPNKQAESCTVCPNNQFQSASNGKGKACKNTRLIAVAPSTALDDSEEGEAPIWILAVPPTSLKAFDGYVGSLSSKHRTVPVGVVTKITLDPGSTYAAPRFDVVRPLKPAELSIVMPRREEATKRLTTEPDVSQYEPPKQVGRNAAAQRGKR